MLTEKPEEVAINKQGIFSYLVQCDIALQRAAVEAICKGCVDLPVYLETYLFIRWLGKKVIKPFSSTPNFCFTWDAENVKLRKINLDKLSQASPDTERSTLLAIEEKRIKEELLEGLRFYLKLAKAIQEEDQLPKITAFGEMKQSRRILNLKDVVNFVPTRLGPNSADAEILKVMLLWGLEKKWDRIWIGGKPNDKLWFIIMSADFDYHHLLRYFKQIDYMNFSFIQISTEDKPSLWDIPNYFIPWDWITHVNYEHKMENILNEKFSPASEYDSKTPYLTRIYMR